MSDLLDQSYLAMDAALQSLKDGCDCGCTDDAQTGLVDAMSAIEAFRSSH